MWLPGQKYGSASWYIRDDGIPINWSAVLATGSIAMLSREGLRCTGDKIIS